ncbi:MAG: hypothetical protein ABJQ78_00410 [Alloalcanivorax sp.]
MKKHFGFISSDLLFSIFLVCAIAGLVGYLTQDVDVNVITELSPEVKQEIREAVKDGIQASRAEELQQLREVQNPPASPRNIHF